MASVPISWKKWAFGAGWYKLQHRFSYAHKISMTCAVLVHIKQPIMSQKLTNGSHSSFISIFRCQVFTNNFFVYSLDRFEHFCNVTLRQIFKVTTHCSYHEKPLHHPVLEPQFPHSKTKSPHAELISKHYANMCFTGRLPAWSSCSHICSTVHDT